MKRFVLVIAVILVIMSTIIAPDVSAQESKVEDTYSEYKFTDKSDT